jgi:hypothetical protein
MARHTTGLHAWQLACVLLLASAAPLLSQEAGAQSSTIPTAGSVALINGNGDVAPKGAARANCQTLGPSNAADAGALPQATARATSRTSARTPRPARAASRRASRRGCRPRRRGTSRVGQRSLALYDAAAPAAGRPIPNPLPPRRP